MIKLLTTILGMNLMFYKFIRLAILKYFFYFYSNKVFTKVKKMNLQLQTHVCKCSICKVSICNNNGMSLVRAQEEMFQDRFLFCV